jgi:hypothetical protein
MINKVDSLLQAAAADSYVAQALALVDSPATKTLWGPTPLPSEFMDIELMKEVLQRRFQWDEAARETLKGATIEHLPHLRSYAFAWSREVASVRGLIASQLAMEAANQRWQFFKESILETGITLAQLIAGKTLPSWSFAETDWFGRLLLQQHTQLHREAALFSELLVSPPQVTLTDTPSQGVLFGQTFVALPTSQWSMLALLLPGGRFASDAALYQASRGSKLRLNPSTRKNLQNDVSELEALFAKCLKDPPHGKWFVRFQDPDSDEKGYVLALEADRAFPRGKVIQRRGKAGKTVS